MSRAQGAVQDLGQVQRRIDGDAVDGRDHFAGCDPALLAVGGTVGNDVADLQAGPFVSALEPYAEVRSHLVPAAGCIGSWRRGTAAAATADRAGATGRGG